MKSIIQKTVACCVIALGLNTSALAQAEEIAEIVVDGAPPIIEGVGDILSPVGTVTDGINAGARTLKGTTTVMGDVDIQVRAGSIRQEITGGEENLNELNLGSVGGGAFIDGGFTTDVTVGSITQKISGTKNRNRANIGSVSD
ncbi:MAG: hypothetical protein ACR2RB_18625 [Gammaproteobacteria bacterium]